MKSKIKIFQIIVFFVFVSPAYAQETKHASHKPVGDRYVLHAGIFRPYVATSLQINNQYTPGTIISLEDDLGFEDRPWLFKVDGYAAITKRSAFKLTYTNLNRKSAWDIDRDINIFDTTFHVGANLDVFFNTTFLSLSYKYNIFTKPTWDAGAAFGIRFLRIKTGAKLETNNFSKFDESVAIAAPAPVFGLYGNAYLNEQLMFRCSFDYFSVSIKGIRGFVIDNNLSLEYYFIKNLGVGAAVNFLAFRIDDLPIGENFDGQIKYNLSGFSLFLAAKF
ncbi:MAG: hypothetical protein JNK61_10110 [Bacteroidia bacterium]|nr:hypothetical protein [Bacteroidia bacterium]HQV00237.1 hypothetical protein [Bacteroidia bacterium]